MPPLQLRLAVPHTPVSFHRETSVPPPTLSVPSGQGPLSPPFLSRLLSLHTNTGRRPEHFRDRARPGPESIHVLCLHVVEGLQELSAHPRWQVAFGGHLALTRIPCPRIQDRHVVVVVVVSVCLSVCLSVSVCGLLLHPGASIASSRPLISLSWL